MVPLYFPYFSSIPKRFFFAALSGFLQYLIFPEHNWAFLVWLALVPLLFSGFQERSGKRAFCLGMISGIVFFSFSCYWIYGVLDNYGNLSWIGAGFLFTLLVLYLSLYQGIFLYLFSRVSLSSTKLSLLSSPIFWVSTEYLRAHVFTGFPWCLLGYGFIDLGGIVQLASYTGVYGLSFLSATTSAIIVSLVFFPSWRYIGFALLIMGAFFQFVEFVSIDLNNKDTNKAYARIVQPNINVEEKWNKETRKKTFNQVTKLSLNRLETKSSPQSVEIIVWPETPAPFYYNHDPQFRSTINRITQKARATLVFGFVDFQTPTNKERLNTSFSLEPYNSVGVVNPLGKLISQYDKIHLVPFGEYVPLEKIFFFIDKISTESGNFKSGKEIVLSTLESGKKIGTVICYEVVVPDLVRQFVSKGAEVLITVTNDAWFGDTSAPYQHLFMARMRAVENNRYLIRAANSGISALVSPSGQILKRTKLNKIDVLEVPFWWREEVTFYSRWGDIFAYCCLAITGILLIFQCKNKFLLAYFSGNK